MKYTVCRDCGEPMGEITVVVAEGHKAGEWITVLEATTESVGKQIRNCILCGEKVDEREIPKLSTVIDEKTGISIDYSAEDYDGEVEITVKETFDGTAFDIVDTSLASTQKFICDIVMAVDGNKTQPEGKVTVRIPLPDGYDYTRTFVYHVDTVTGNLEKMQAKYVDGYLVFETTHFSYYAVIVEPDIDNCSCKCHNTCYCHTTDDKWPVVCFFFHRHYNRFFKGRFIPCHFFHNFYCKLFFQCVYSA